jgi:hypothetical protein
MVDDVLDELSPLFDAMYASTSRPSIPSEKLLRAQLIQMLYPIRSERLMEEIGYSVLFRWFVGLNMDEEVWDPTTFTKNRDQLLDADVAKEFLTEAVKQAEPSYPSAWTLTRLRQRLRTEYCESLSRRRAVTIAPMIAEAKTRRTAA